MIRSAYAVIKLARLTHNLNIVRSFAPQSKVMAVVKADAYGHGLIKTAQALNKADAFAVSCANEALELRAAGILHPIICLQGFTNTKQLQQIVDANIQTVIHSEFQIRLLNECNLKQALQVWLKIDTGMSRLGIHPEKTRPTYQKLLDTKRVAKIRFMTHFANADLLEEKSVQNQLQKFATATSDFPGSEKSAANSAATLAYSSSQFEWVRPGLALYGLSPYQLGHVQPDISSLRPVMSLYAPLIAIKQCRQGDSIGYGGTYTCAQDMRIGIVAIGYADGYPRSIASNTKVSVNGSITQVLGRVSMDMLAIDTTNIDVKIGDDVELWGDDISATEIANHASVISYELLCGISGKVDRKYE